MNCKSCNKSFLLLSREYKCCMCNSIICSNCVSKIKRESPLYDKAYEIFSPLSIVNFQNTSKWNGSLFFCPTCRARFQQEYQMLLECENNLDNVRIFSINYKGKIPKSTLGGRIVKTNFYKNRCDAEYDLKLITKYLGGTSIINVKYNKDTDSRQTDSGGEYYYTIWQAEGEVIL